MTKRLRVSCQVDTNVRHYLTVESFLKDVHLIVAAAKSYFAGEGLEAGPDTSPRFSST